MTRSATRLMGLAAFFAVGCGASPSPAPAASPAPASTLAPPAAEAPKPVTATQGGLVTYQAGEEVGREQFHDDGQTLVSELAIAGQKATVTLTRAPRHVRVESGGQKVEVDVPDATIVLENGSWQAYAIAAAWFPGAAALPVMVLVPGQGARVPGTLWVTPAAAGGTTVKVDIRGLEVVADVDARGVVTHAAVPAQGVEATPEGQPAPVVADRPAPTGVTAEPFEVGAAKIAGELWRPAAASGKVPVVVLIAGSGPTDRDGNSSLGMRTDAYRKLAEALAARGVASMRYDKRGVGKSVLRTSPDTLTVDDFVADAASVVQQARGDARLGPVVVLGHSEGGLIALLLAQKTPVDGLVLVATAGRPLAAVLHEQLARQLDASGMKELDRVLAALRSGAPVDPVAPPLDRLFPREVRTFLKSELDVDPVPLFHASKVPAAIIQGEHDAQVTPADARLLAGARRDAKVTLLPKMNHVFRDEASATLPQASYADPSLPLSAGLVEAVVGAVRARK